ncbi:ankyrin repeat and SOCS box protein 2-like isoform 1-T1 [Salvelinus alpinus]
MEQMIRCPSTGHLFNMAVASMAMPGSTAGPTLGFDDYSLYSNLSDDELMQLAIERSLSDATAPGEASNTTTALGRRIVQYRANPPPTRVNPPNPPRQEPSHRPPTAKPTDAEEDTIVKAILNGDVTTLRAMAKDTGNNILRPDKYGWIPLHEAAYYGQDQCVRVLLGAQPGMINKCDLKGQTALILAVGRERVACVKALLEKGADPELATKERETPLYKACERENAEIVAMLLNHGAVVNKHCIQGWTALQEAVSRNSVEICEMLVQAGAKLSPTNMYGITPLFTAAQSGCVETLRFLIKHGADINSEASDGATALYEAAKNGHEDIVKLLLSQNADANKAGKKGLLPLHIAAQRGTDGKTLLTYDFYNYDKSVNIVSLLIKATSKSRVNRSGISPLHLAAECNRDEVLEVLIEAGYDVNAMLSDDRSKMYEDHRSTILYFAVTNGNVEATTMLLEAGANPNLDTFNTLLVAVRQGSIELVTLLVEHGANVNAYVPTHPTSFPATVMFSMKYLSMLKYLMDNGCDAHSCFTCTYGSGPHPPIQETSERDDLRYNNDTRRNTGKAVQFCEIISTQAINRWAGPIIDILLDYVGHVKLCSRLTEHLDSFEDWEAIKEKATPPRPLMQLCRLKIRQQVGIHRLRCINKLPLPPRVIKYLNHEERNQEEFCAF